MSALHLVSPPPCPVVAGDTVHVPEPVPCPSGRAIPRGHYPVLYVEDTPPEHAERGRYRVVVAAWPDCSALGSRFQRPTGEERRAGAEVPLAAQVTRFFLYPGDFTRYAGDGIETLPDHPLQTD